MTGPNSAPALEPADASIQAQEIWNAAEPAPESHAFFYAWRVPVPGLRVYRGELEIDGVPVDEMLIAPMRDAQREIRNLAFLAVDGKRTYLVADQVIGLYFGLGGRGSKAIAIANGLISGARVHEATGHAVAVAFSGENVEKVASMMQSKYPGMDIVLASQLGIGGTQVAATVSPEEVGSESAKGSDADALHNWIRRKGLTSFLRKDVLQRAPPRVRKAERAGPALRELIERRVLETSDDVLYCVVPAVEPDDDAVEPSEESTDDTAGADALVSQQQSA